ncbi:MAG: membrane protein insertase YidC [Prevotellaceae bacterium]|jgi:YidC/Oxa1 family membrane protein insertase|nr:membrane protein insertase YidC [Prevotellaceae bacterium]
MDKNTVTGFLLIALIFLGYMWWSSNNAEHYNAERKKINDSIAIIEKEREILRLQTKDKDSIEQAIAKEVTFANLGKMAASLNGDENFYTVENEKLKITFSNRGARIWSIEFKDYQKYDDFKANNGTPLKMFYGDENAFSFILPLKAQNISTSDFYFEPEMQNQTLSVTADSVNIPFRLYADSASYIEFLYTVHKDSYKIGFNVNFVAMESHLNSRATAVNINWKLNLFQQEKGFVNENNYTTIAYKYPNEESIEDISASKESATETVKTKLEWVNFKQHFFSAIFVTGGSVNNKLSFVSYKENPSKLLKTCEADMQLEFNIQKNKNIPMELYFLPNHFSTLKSYGHSFEKIIPLGGSIFALINRAVVIPVFNLLNGHIASFGLIILILTILVKLLIFPLTWKSYLSSAKMKALKPEVDKIGAKYPDSKDALKKQQEVMALYKKTGVNMFGGCLPMLLQLPILIALFRFFPSSIELRHKSFLWADDLSAYDSIFDLPFSIPFYGAHISLFTLLMAASMIISSKINMSQQGGLNAQMKQMNIMMTYIMPVFMLAFFNSYSSGLTYYYFLSNIITIIQTTIIRKYFVNEDELRRKLSEKATRHQAKPKKLSFTERLMKKQRELERLNKQQEKNRRKKK